ncbi:MAG: Hydrolase [Candidatus Saccharibacteria bacterium]|nr:Hydrolase [Candidatus Saccharibacteria bacterium]
MHFIQKHILDELRLMGDMRYAALQPEGIESGHFRYHLKELEREGYVASPKRGVYQLTTKGQHFVDRLSRGSVNAVNMPKVITYTLLTQDDNYLLQRKDKQPYKGLLNMIGGKVHEGETTAVASSREVYEKTSLAIEAPALSGVCEILIRDGDALLTHVIAYIYSAEVANSTSHDLVAIPISELANAEGLAPDTIPIISSLHEGGLVLATFELTLQ